MGKPLSFLIVEDDENVRRLIERALRAHGEVDAVSSCAAARLALRSHTFDALIVDVHLADGSGMEVLELARAKSPSLVAVVLTGTAEREVLLQSHENGARFLLKPVDMRVLLGIVEEVNTRRNARERRTAVVLERWITLYALTPAEAELITLAVQGVSREEIGRRRGVADGTIRKQIQGLLRKTRSETFEGAVSHLLREALAEPT